MNNKSNLFYFLLLIWPFVFLLPLSSGYIAMGNDFDLIYYSYKKYIFEFWQDGQLPFWSPSEGAGFSLIYNPFAQFFYIPSWILFFICDLKNSFSLYDYLIYTIFGISIYCLGQYQWLKSIKFSNNEIKYVVTLLVPTTLLITNFLRLPNAIQTICWLPFLLLGINYTLNKKKYLKSFLLLFFSSLFIFTAGYPYFIFYIFIFTILYFIFILNFQNINLRDYPYILIKSLVPVIFSFVLTAPWLNGVIKTLQISQDRNLNDYLYSTEGGFKFLDIVGSWLYPVLSNTEGRYYFGIIISFIIFKFFLDLIFKISKITYLEKKLILFVIISFSLITFISASESKLFQFFWNEIKFIQNIRTWPRVNILLLPILSIIIVFSFNNILNNLTKIEKGVISKYHISTTNILLFAILFVQFYFFISESVSDYWTIWHKKRFLFAEEILPFPINNLIMFVDGRINILTSILAILLFNFLFINKKKFQLKKNTLFILILSLVVFEQFLNSNLQWSLKKWKTVNTYDDYKAIEKLNINFNKPRIKNQVHGNNYFRDDAYTINNFLNWGNKFHNSIFWKYFDKYGQPLSDLNDVKLEKIETFFALNKKNKKIFFTDSIVQKNIINFVDESRFFEKNNNISYKIINYSNNNITIEFYSSTNGYLSYIDNTDLFWRAYINKNEVKILKLMDTYKSIYFEKGKNLIEFKYEPFRY